MKYELIGTNDASNVIKTVLHNRGIEDPNTYLHLTNSVVQDYNKLSNIQEAVQCFVKHYEAHDKVVIMPDEDCDGYTSSAMLFLYIIAIEMDYAV